MIRALCNHRFIPGNGIIGSGTFFIFKKNSERMEEGIGNFTKSWSNFQTCRKGKFLDSNRVPGIVKKKITRIIFEKFEPNGLAVVKKTF